jgi:hypothetical protein
MSLENQWLYNLDNSDLDTLYNANDDLKTNSEPDFELNPLNNMLLLLENFYTIEDEM